MGDNSLQPAVLAGAVGFVMVVLAVLNSYFGISEYELSFEVE